MSRRRLVLATLAFVALALTSGCLGFFTDNQVNDDKLDEEPPTPYQWDRSTDVRIEVSEGGEFTGVYPANTSSVELYRRDGFGGRRSLDVSAVRYRYPNGTVVNGSTFDERGGEITKSRQEVTVTFPTDGPSDRNGSFAFTGPSTPKRFSLPVFVEGSYEVVLPPDRRVDFPVFGSVSPGNYDATRTDARTHIVWPSVSGRAVVVQYYLQRDLYIFGLLFGGLAVVGLGGVLYYRRQISRLRERREEVGVDVDTDDDEFGRDPPPGMG